MRLLAVEIRNFGPFRGVVELALDKLGLVSVVGVNRADPGFDANGVGKSSILDAIMWGLFGETSARKETSTNESGLKGDEVVNEAVGKDCVVLVTVERDDGETFVITRYRKAKVGERKRGSGVLVERKLSAGREVVADLDAGEVQKHIDAILGLDRALFAQTVLRSQEDSFSFAQATPKERFSILTKIEGLEELDAWDAKFRERGRALSTSLALAAQDAVTRESSLALYREEAARDAQQADLWAHDRRERQAAIVRRIDDQRVVIQAIDGRLAEQPAHEARLRDLDAALAQLPDGAIADPPELLAWDEHRRGLQQRVGAARGEHVRASEAEKRARTLRAGACPHCGQDVPAAHVESHLATLTAAVKAAADARTAAEAEDAQAATVISQARAQLEAHRRAAYEHRARLVNDRAHVVSALKVLASERANRDGAAALISSLTSEIAIVQTALNPFRTRTDERATRIMRMEADLATARGEEARQRVEAGLVEWWVRNVPSLKAWIFDSVVDEITREANRWLSILTGGLCWVEIRATETTKAGDVRDRVSLRCFRWNADGTQTEREFRQWSGGEKRRIALAVDWALSARLAQRAKSRCSFLALDEVDRHLDAAGRAGLLAALDVLRREKGTVCIVTHDPDMRAKPDVTWVVTKTKDGSSVEVVRGQDHQAREPEDVVEARQSLSA